ncbi:hypothetical protein ART_2270 [Arthrobacter sp. PAMC 25486]|nr:hypothetical protein ART_2270 [Arthrobacter sp. PAMC 25486]
MTPSVGTVEAAPFRFLALVNEEISHGRDRPDSGRFHQTAPILTAM